MLSAPIRSIFLAALLILPGILGSIPTTTADFNKSVYDFDLLYYHPTQGFNKQGTGSLVAAVTYTNNTPRVIDYASATLQTDPFFFEVSFINQLETDPEGNPVEPAEGYFYLRDEVIKQLIPQGARSFASKNLNYSTVTFQDNRWYRVRIPDFNRAYSWGTYTDPAVGETWFSWGNNDTVSLSERAMSITKIQEGEGRLILDFDHPGGNNQGQTISISKEYLHEKGITTPVFEWGDKKPWLQISYSENQTHYFLTPEHFSQIGIHEASTGTSEGGFFWDYETTNDTDQIPLVWFGDNVTENTVDPGPPNSKRVVAGYSYMNEVSQTFQTNGSYIIGGAYCTMESYSGAKNFAINTTFKSGSTVLAYGSNNPKPMNTGTDIIWGGDLLDTHLFRTSTQETLKMHFRATDGVYNIKYNTSTDAYPDGEGWVERDNDYGDLWFKVTGWRQHFNVTRTTGSTSETNLIDHTSEYYYNDSSGVLQMKIPISDDVSSILRVYNNQTDVNRSAAATLGALNNTTYYWDSANQYVYIGLDNVSSGDRINYQINCSKGATFCISPPKYLQTGDNFAFRGLIKDADGDPISGTIATTEIIASDGTSLLSSEWNCTSGNYATDISTTSIEPGSYQWRVTFTDSVSGVSFTESDNLYIGYETPGTGVYSDAIIHVRYYNTNQGLGLPVETLKFYVNGTRQPDLEYYTATSRTHNITIRDYYNSTLYTTNIIVNHSHTYLDLGLTFHEYDFANLNNEWYVIGFLKQGASRWYEKVIPGDGHESFLLPTGNYTIRVTDADQDVLLSYNQTVNCSRGYTIQGNQLAQVIEGLSVIEGQILELRQEFDDAIMPDTVYIDYNPCIIFSVWDRIGQLLGQDVWEICPPINVIATTINETYDDNITSYPLIPSNGTSSNGTISVPIDELYLSGSSTWVNISYTNGTTIQNTTYTPSKVDLPNGATITIKSSSNIYIRRETTYSQVKMFYWTVYNSTINPGHISGRPGYHVATVNVSNPLNVELSNVYVYVGFSDDAAPDLNTIRVRDLENGHLLDRGESFKATGDAIEFRISGGMSSSESREFTMGYYSDQSAMYGYTDGQVTLHQYTPDVAYRDEFFNYAEFLWVNHGDLVSRAGIRVNLNFNIEVDPSSIYVFDLDNNELVGENHLIIGQNSILLAQSSVGDVSVGSGRKYGVYFQEMYYPGRDAQEATLSSPLLYLNGVAISLGLIITLIGFLLIGAGLIIVVQKGDRKDSLNSGLSLLALGIVLDVLIFILQAK